MKKFSEHLTEAIDPQVKTLSKIKKEIDKKAEKVRKAMQDLEDAYRDNRKALINILGPNSDPKGSQIYEMRKAMTSIDKLSNYMVPEYIGKLGE